jgi:hypothetical protein
MVGLAMLSQSQSRARARAAGRGGVDGTATAQSYRVSSRARARRAAHGLVRGGAVRLVGHGPVGPSNSAVGLRCAASG